MKMEVSMGKVAVAIFLILVTSSVVLANWLTDFKNIFLNEGIDKAVVEAMKEGATPDSIVEKSLAFEGLNPANLIKALYCAGAQGQDIKKAAERYEISELLVAAGYKKSIAECGEQVADSQPFTPVQTGTSFVSVDPGGGGDNASEFTFNQ